MSNALHENLANVRIETDDGDLLPAMDVAGEKLAQLILAVSANQKPGTLTLKITVRPSTAGALAVKADVAFALQAAGWYLRQDIIWHKPNPMPESVTDRCTKAHEYLFLLTKSERYYFDAVAIQEDAQIWTGRAGTFDRSGNPLADHVIPGQSAAQHRPRVNERDRKALRTDVENRHRSSIPGGQSLQAEPNGKRNRRSVWTVPTQPYSGAHFAVFPAALIEPCVLAGSRPGDVVLDPFMGSGTTSQVAQALGRQWIGCELNTEYAPLQQARTSQAALAI